MILAQHNWAFVACDVARLAPDPVVMDAREAPGASSPCQRAALMLFAFFIWQCSKVEVEIG
jgi:hypothetical protein